ncbi:hypothetical protein CPB85DRAFT_1299833 [Mucidula mucida]|nr:hypothetical protein CPB85DRAFT_1299833 [Mucidula mucida]
MMKSISSGGSIPMGDGERSFSEEVGGGVAEQSLIGECCIGDLFRTASGKTGIWSFSAGRSRPV